MVTGTPSCAWAPPAPGPAVAALVPVDGAHHAAQRGPLEVPGVLGEAVAVAEDDGDGGGGLAPEQPPPARRARPPSGVGLVHLVVQLGAVVGVRLARACRAAMPYGPAASRASRAFFRMPRPTVSRSMATPAAAPAAIDAYGGARRCRPGASSPAAAPAAAVAALGDRLRAALAHVHPLLFAGPGPSRHPAGVAGPV